MLGVKGSRVSVGSTSRSRARYVPDAAVNEGQPGAPTVITPTANHQFNARQRDHQDTKRDNF